VAVAQSVSLVDNKPRCFIEGCLPSNSPLRPRIFFASGGLNPELLEVRCCEHILWEMRLYRVEIRNSGLRRRTRNVIGLLYKVTKPTRCNTVKQYFVQITFLIAVFSELESGPFRSPGYSGGVD
jgi:hypothetical protein